jgi:hypothetical protein
MYNDLIYLETYVLQKDMRIRLPKSIIANLDAEKGKTRFEIYYDKLNESIVLKKEAENLSTDMNSSDAESK